jgi:hypothetical protein
MLDMSRTDSLWWYICSIRCTNAQAQIKRRSPIESPESTLQLRAVNRALERVMLFSQHM